MSKPLSLDPRTRVLAAISGGLSCWEAAVRFGVSASSAIRWRALERRQGDAKPKAAGGDLRSEYIERHRDAIRSLVDETSDLTLEEIRTALAEQGASASYGALSRFLRRHKITRKKRPRTRPSSVCASLADCRTVDNRCRISSRIRKPLNLRRLSLRQRLF